MRLPVYIITLLFFSMVAMGPALSQPPADTTKSKRKKKSDAGYIIKLDTLLHLYSSVSANEVDYTLVYSEDFKLVLAPNKLNSLSFGFSYRYLDLGLSFTPAFLNSGKDSKKGESQRLGLKTSVGFHRFLVTVDLNSVKGFYLQNSQELRSALPDTPYVVYPDLKVGNFSVMLRYNINPRFSTAALTGGTQIQQRSTWTVLPTFQLATFKFHNDSNDSGVHNEYTNSTDVNLLLPLAGTLVISPTFSASMGFGPSIGVDFYKSVAVNDSGKVVTTKGTKPITGYTFQAAISYHPGRFFAGIEARHRSYGHKIEDISRLIKQYSYFQVYIGWRLRAPGFMKKTLDWLNKISPIDLE